MSNINLIYCKRHYKLLCFGCKRFYESLKFTQQVQCEVCKTTFYCSLECMEADKIYHKPHCQLLPIIDKDKGLKKEETSFVILLLRLLSNLYHNNNDDNNNKKKNFIQLKHILNMMQDNATVAGYKRRQKQRERAAKYFVTLLNNSSNNNNSLDDMLKVHPQFLNVGVLTSILAAGPLNEFALFDVDGEAVGCGYFPLAAMANHSCIPTASVQMEGKDMVFYATRNLQVGEEITQSYANLGDDGRLTRMENIEVSWGFTCSCLRCKIDSGSGGDESSCNIIKNFDEANVCVCGGVIVPKARQGKREDDECKCNSYNLIV